MNLPSKNTSRVQLLLLGLALSVFIIYPNLACFLWDLRHMPKTEYTAYILFFLFRYVFFALLIWTLLTYNLKKLETPVFLKRLLHSCILTVLAYLVYIAVSFISHYKADCFTGQLLFQFLVTCMLCTFIGHVSLLYLEKRRKELEIEQLKTENLQSRYDALTNQIHPHFFFNSLNGLTSLIRKDDKEITLAYVNKLSDVFRYILQSENKGLVTLEEELGFVEALRYMMEVRFANKLEFNIQINKQ